MKVIIFLLIFLLFFKKPNKINISNNINIRNRSYNHIKLKSIKSNTKLSTFINMNRKKYKRYSMQRKGKVHIVFQPLQKIKTRTRTLPPFTTLYSTHSYLNTIIFWHLLLHKSLIIQLYMTLIKLVQDCKI
jgi:hypothetical protein